jgi:hypothetical protein
VFTYYLKEDLKTLQEQRRELEKKLEASGESTPYPGWEAIRAEEKEEPPAVVLTVTDSEGNIVRQIEGPIEAGFHRVAWDLRYPLSSPWTPEAPKNAYIRIVGPLAAPGSYRVNIGLRKNGLLTDLGMEQTFSVRPMRERGLRGATPEQVVAFSRQLDDLSREVKGALAAVTSMLTETGAIKQTLLRSNAPQALRDQARTLELELMDIQDQIQGNKARGEFNDFGPVSITRRLEVATMGTFRSTYGPTPTHSSALDIASSEFDAVKSRLQQINELELPALRKQLDEAGAPWTPGRGVPAGD